jgi:hypothetical protein
VAQGEAGAPEGAKGADKELSPPLVPRPAGAVPEGPLVRRELVAAVEGVRVAAAEEGIRHQSTGPRLYCQRVSSWPNRPCPRTGTSAWSSPKG